MIDTSRAMNGDSANKFISALVKSLQTLCHGYVEFNDGIEIIGHLYLNIDSGSSFDYVVKEKVCKNAENSTVFVSKSFQAQAPAEECIIRKEKDDEHSVFEDSSNMSPTTGTSSRLQSAITSISNVLSGTQHDSHKSRLIDHSTHHPPSQNTSKRKREHNGSYSSMQPPYKYTTLQATSSSYFNSALSSAKQAGDRNHSEHFSNPPHSEFFGGESNQSSGMGHDDEDDLDLDVTFVKEEFESQRNSGQRGVTASRLSQDPSSSQSNMLHDSGGLGYSTNHHQAPQQFASGTAGDMGSLSQSFQDPSQLDMSQHSSQGPPNPRSDGSPTPRHGDCRLPTTMDFTVSQPFNSVDMTSISDTLQLGMKLFGPKFVADVTAGDLSLPVPLNMTDEGVSALTEPVNDSVFPEMFDVTTIRSTSVKPGHKVLWQDRKDKIKRSLMMRKANLGKIRSRSSIKKPLEIESQLPPPLPEKSQNVFPTDLCAVPLKRKRGRPPKILKMMSKSEFLLENVLNDEKKCISSSSVNFTGKEDNSFHKKDLATSLSAEHLCLKPLLLGECSSRRIRGSYRQYTPADKLEIVEFGIKYGSTAASRKYNIPESTVRSWTKKMDIFLMQMKQSEQNPMESHLHKNTIGHSEDIISNPEQINLTRTSESIECQQRPCIAHDLSSAHQIEVGCDSPDQSSLTLSSNKVTVPMVESCAGKE